MGMNGTVQDISVKASTGKFHRNSMGWPFNFIHYVLVSVFTWFVGIVSVLSCCVTLYSFVLLHILLDDKGFQYPHCPHHLILIILILIILTPLLLIIRKNILSSYIMIIDSLTFHLIIVFLELFPGTSLDFTLFADHGIVNPHEQVFQRPFGRRQTSSRPEQDGLSS